MLWKVQLNEASRIHLNEIIKKIALKEKKKAMKMYIYKQSFKYSFFFLKKEKKRK